MDYGFGFLLGTVAVQQLRHDARGHELRHELSPFFTEEIFFPVGDLSRSGHMHCLRAQGPSLVQRTEWCEAVQH